MAGLGLPPRARAGMPATASGWRRFEITTRVALPDTPGAAQLWLPVAQTASFYQTAGAPAWSTGGRATVLHDRRYGAGLVQANWDGADRSPRRIDMLQTVLTRDRDGGSRAPLVDADRRLWTAATESLPTDGIVRDTAMRIVAGRIARRDRLRALYDWVVDSTRRDPATPGCGTGDVRTMLQTGHLGGKCADINSLMVALARAAGLPARDVYGRVAASRLYPSLGRSGDVSLAQHCRAEVFLDGAEWFPVDPADVRKVVLDGGMPLNSATDIALPGAGPGQVPNFPFLMYPCAFTASGQPDCLDPAHVRYEIHARELTV